MNIDDLKAYIESRFPVYAGKIKASSRAPTGEYFANIGFEQPKPGDVLGDFTGVIREGRHGTKYPCQDDALRGARVAFDDYAEGKTGQLFWRQVPYLERDMDHQTYWVWMRLLISGAPIMDEKNLWTKPSEAMGNGVVVIGEGQGGPAPIPNGGAGGGGWGQYVRPNHWGQAYQNMQDQRRAMEQQVDRREALYRAELMQAFREFRERDGNA